MNAIIRVSSSGEEETGSVGMSIYLEDEQLALFEQLLEAWRATPRDQRGPFIYVRTMGANIVQGNGVNCEVPDGDIEALALNAPQL